MSSLRFLTLFQDNKQLGRDSLKFAKTFHCKVDHEDSTVVGSKEDWYTAGTILKEHGFSFSEFDTVEKALAAVRHLCKKNQEGFGYEPKAESIDEAYPQFSKFWFVFSLGKTEQHTSTVGKKLEQETDLKNLEQLEQAKIFMEGIGFQGDTGASQVKIENVKYQELQKTVEMLKMPYSSDKLPGDNANLLPLLATCVYTYI